tara:strand:- start:269 stop:964 length:696 start_codon:yes stop_codon:yes gene_type:complete
MNAGGEWLGGLVLVAGLAALMSTMDSQLLATGSLVTRDLLDLNSGGRARYREVVIVGLATLGLLLSLWSELSILDLGLLAFTMYAVLFPSVFLAAHFKDIRAGAVIASIVAGEAMVLLAAISPESYAGWWVVPAGPAMPVAIIPSLAAAVIALVIGQSLTSPGSFRWDALLLPSRQSLLSSLPLLCVFVLAHDYWWWEEGSPWALGLPIWIWWAALLSLIQTAIMVRLTKS